MSTTCYCIEKQVKAFCTQIGADPLLVQGAGGNVSWKDGDVMWVKASGTWLAEAEFKDIFVPVNLAHLKTALANNDFSVKPEVMGNSGLRPSIETLLHALMPHTVVLHLHAVEILTHLVQVNAKGKIKKNVGESVKWIYIDYLKPGADLARAVSQKFTSGPDINVVFMGNHGVVIGGNDIEDVASTLRRLISKLQTMNLRSLSESSPSTRKADFLAKGYVPFEDKEVGQIVIKDSLLNILRNEWALYPDHVVFLGAEPAILEKNFSLLDLDKMASRKPPFIFSVNDGIYESLHTTAAQKCQMRCYYDVIIRIGSSDKLTILSDLQVSELLNWDAEKYRQNGIYSNFQTL